ncbi:YIR024C [Zygosaccharomyces parabailii]|nr:YIR024C [Zygosaccharomyces parabailii]
MPIMLGRVVRPLSVCRVYSQISPRPTKTSRFDRTIIKPLLVVILFGTMLTHVTNQQRLAGEMERRYFLKIEILKDLIERAREGDTKINVQEELKLVNKLFERTSEARELNSREAEKLQEISSSQNYSEKEVLQSLNRSPRALEKESLDDLLKSIMDEISDAPKQPIPRKTSPKPNSNEVIVDKDVLKEEAKYERELSQYKPSTDVHLIVENPGELSSAAEDTKVTKFL